MKYQKIDRGNDLTIYWFNKHCCVVHYHIDNAYYFFESKIPFCSWISLLSHGVRLRKTGPVIINTVGSQWTVPLDGLSEYGYKYVKEQEYWNF